MQNKSPIWMRRNHNRLCSPTLKIYDVTSTMGEMFWFPTIDLCCSTYSIEPLVPLSGIHGSAAAKEPKREINITESRIMKALRFLAFHGIMEERGGEAKQIKRRMSGMSTEEQEGPWCDDEWGR